MYADKARSFNHVEGAHFIPELYHKLHSKDILIHTFSLDYEEPIMKSLSFKIVV